MTDTLLHTHSLTINIGNTVFCENLNFSLKAGEIWGIFGCNGSGKTTLLHHLAGLYPTTASHVFLKKTALKKISRKQAAQQLAILFQETHLVFPQTIWDFCLGARYPHSTSTTVDETIVTNALQNMQLIAKKHQPITTLSGGEKRRAAIAAIIAQTPAVFLLDEPTNHLDIRYQMLVLNYFKTLALQNATGIVMALHDIQQARQFCNRFLLMLPDHQILMGGLEILTVTNLQRVYDYPFETI